MAGTTSNSHQERGPRCTSTRGAARYIGRAEATLIQWRIRGEGPPYIKQGRAVVYDFADLDSWMDQRRRISTSDDGNVLQVGN